MQNVAIKICEIGDEKPVWPDMLESQELKITECVTLEAGMASGSTSLGFRLEDAYGELYLCQVSASILECINSARVGAEACFAEKRSRGK